MGGGDLVSTASCFVSVMLNQFKAADDNVVSRNVIQTF